MPFTTVGRKNDTCGHEHPTRDEAQQCLVRHQSECRKALKVSNRSVIEIESLDEVFDEWDAPV